MNRTRKSLLRCLFVALVLAAVGIPQELIAIVGRPLTPISVAGVARRTTRRVVVASSVSAQNQAAAAQSQAAAAQSQAAQQTEEAAKAAEDAAAAAESAAAASQAAAQSAATAQQATSGVPAVGTIVTVLPGDCPTTTLNGVQYYNCGGVYYRAAFQGNNLVYVVQQP